MKHKILTWKMVIMLVIFLGYKAHAHTSSSSVPYTLGIRDSFMIAHSFHNHPSFGPAGKMHGATYTCDVEFKSSSLAPTVNWVIDIGFASTILADVLKKYNYKNLDEIFLGEDDHPIFTTTEFMAKQIYLDLIERLKSEGYCDFDNRKCEESNENIYIKGKIKVTLWESHKAWASYEGDF